MTPMVSFVTEGASFERRVGEFSVHITGGFKRMTAMAVYRLAHAVRDGMRREFIAGTDGSGVSHNKTGQSLSTLKVSYGAMSATITMGGGGYYVEYRQPPHWIEATSGSALHWSDEGGDYFYQRVFHPGYKGDKFVERAIHSAVARRDVWDRVLFHAMARGDTNQDWQGPTMSDAGIDPYQT